MNRRNVLKIGALASCAALIPYYLNELGFFEPKKVIPNFKRLILIQLSGGNDGLNTIVPVGNDVYHRARPTIGYRKLDYDLDKGMYFNPSLYGLKGLYDEGDLCLINDVGYPNPNRSHFRSTDIWHSASSARQYINTGWVGRLLDSECLDPIAAIQVNPQLEQILRGEQTKGLLVQNVHRIQGLEKNELLYDYIQSNPKTHGAHANQNFLYKTLIQSNASIQKIKEEIGAKNKENNFPQTRFGRDMSDISSLIRSGVPTKIFYSSLIGFDTHVHQKGKHEHQLKVYDEGISALVKDLKKIGQFENTLILTFSEFGRRVEENKSKGTDHGAANNLFLMGGKLKKPGMYNEPSNLLSLDEIGDIQYRVDFRSIYATILKNWLGVNPEDVLNGKFEILDDLI